jgi:cardiolipin synthase
MVNCTLRASTRASTTASNSRLPSEQFSPLACWVRSRSPDDCPADRAGFDDDRSFATGEEAMGTGSARQELASRGSAARTFVAGPDQEVDQLVLVLLSAINLARRSIRVATPFFLPDEATHYRAPIGRLARRGRASRFATIAWLPGPHRRICGPLLQSGCHLWRSAPPLDHSKLMTIDGSWSLIGSANWDMRSLRLNFELTVEFYDTDLAGKLAGMIDARCAQPIILEEIDKRPLPYRSRARI